MTQPEVPHCLTLLLYNIFHFQEIYWRIPGHFSVQDLRKRVEVIAQALDGRMVTTTSKYFIPS